MRVHHSAVYETAPTSGKECFETLDVEELISGSQYSGNYSGNQPEELITPEDVVPGDEHYDVESAVRTGNERCSPRIPCRNVLACIRTQFESIVVKVTDLSRKGMCFRSAEKFWMGTPVSVATYYIEGGQNIFQNGRIVRERYSPSGVLTEYGIEF